MAMPERPQYESPELAELLSKLEDVQRQLEVADENENQLERFFRRDDLLKQQDWLQEQIDNIR